MSSVVSRPAGPTRTGGTGSPPHWSTSGTTADRDAQTRHFAFLSYLRVLAIVGVVLLHTMAATTQNTRIEGTPTWHAAIVVSSGFQWRVAVLVMVSGALLLRPKAGEGAWEFYRRRLQRIGIPLATWHVVYLVFLVVFVGVDLTVSQWIARLASAKLYTALYFFWLILGLYLLAPVLRAFLAQASKRDQWTIAVLATSAGLLNEIVSGFIRMQGGTAGGPYNVVTYCLPYVGYFMLGYLLKDVVLPRRWTVVVALGAVLIAAEKVWQRENLAELPVLNLLTPLSYLGFLTAVFSVLVFVLVRSLVPPTSWLAQPRIAVPLRRIGDLTLGVYATHLLVMAVLQRQFHMTDGPTTLRELVFLPLATLVGAFAISWVLSKIPYVRRAV
ncbi:MAG TPA: acyltransferase [Actinopolymorphaceae bacterium]